MFVSFEDIDRCLRNFPMCGDVGTSIKIADVKITWNPKSKNDLKTRISHQWRKQYGIDHLDKFVEIIHMGICINCWITALTKNNHKKIIYDLNLNYKVEQEKREQINEEVIKKWLLEGYIISLKYGDGSGYLREQFEVKDNECYYRRVEFYNGCPSSIMDTSLYKFTWKIPDLPIYIRNTEKYVKESCNMPDTLVMLILCYIF